MKLKIALPHDSAIYYQLYIPEERKFMLIQKHAYDILFVIITNRKHPKCPSIGQWLNKL